MSKVVRVAVVGYGGMGGWHTKRLQEIPGVVELAGVYDIKPERNKVAEENVQRAGSVPRPLRFPESHL